MSPARAWLFRIGVWIAFVATLWFAGPRAYAVVRGQLGGSDGAFVDLDRVGFLRTPPWFHGELAAAALQDLTPRLQGKVQILDEEGARALRERLLASPWVASARLERVFPDRFRIALELREPRLVVVREVRGARRPEVVVDEHGWCLPVVAAIASLPVTPVTAGPAAVPGRRHADPRVLAAAQVVVEWQRQVAPLVPDCPPLAEVDARNLDYRWIADPAFSEVLVGLRRADGGIARMCYDHPPGDAAPRVPAADKAAVLRNILLRHPGLQGLDGADLRFKNRWADYLRLAR
jgi:hypothetical protein